MKLLLICLFFLCFISPVSGYDIDGDTVYIDDVNVHLSATPHTLASSGWVYFNLTSKQYTGDLDVVWGFNTSISKPTRGELYSPHWVNTTTDHELFLYNVSQLQVYYGDDLDYGNSYNSFQYSGTYQVQTYNETTMEPDGYETVTSNVSFDSSVQDGDNYTIYWHTRHDKWTLWKDKTSTFQSVTYDYEGYDKWYYIKDVGVTAGTEYTMRAWVEVPVSLTPQSGKYYYAVKPSGETIAQAVANGHFYALDPWWNSSWTYYKTLTINQTMVNQSMGDVHYTMLVDITDTDLRDHAQADGDDIVFVDSTNTTQLDHQLKFNGTTGHLVAYVNVTDISNVTSINMYYNNSGATDTQDKAGTWGVNASGIWLMDEGTGSYVNDSSGNDNNGTITGADWNVSGGLDFIAVNSDYIDCGQVVSGYPFTMTVRAFSNSSALGMFASIAGDEPYYHAIAYDGSTDYVYVRSYDLNSFNFVTTMDLNDGFHTISGVWKNASSRALYVDGKYKGVSNALETGIEYTSTKIGVTADSTPIGYQNGTIAYTHIYNSALSNESISTTYNNTEYPTLFISIGDEQSEAADTTDPTYSNVAHNTTVAGATVKFSIQYNDDTALHTNGQYIFATNNTGTWVNETAVNWTATPEYANVTKTLNSTVDAIIGYRWYANDTAGNSNNTPIYTLTVTSVSDSSFTVSLPAGQTAINFTAITCKDTLLEPGGQTAGVPIVNVTNTGNVVQSFRFYLNTTVSNVLTYTSLSSDLSNPIEINTTTTTVIITNLPASNSDNVWMYCNLSTPSPGTTGKLLTVNSS